MKTDFRKKLISALQDGEISEPKLASILQKILLEHEKQQPYLEEPLPLTELFDKTIKSIWTPKGDSYIIKTGYKGLDKLTGGFFPGEFVVLGGRPSMGKTQMLVNLALNISRSCPVLYFSLDMPPYLLGSRFISALSKIGINRILSRDFQEDEQEELIEVRGMIDKHKIIVSSCGSNSMDALKSQVISSVEKYGIKVVMIDYLQLMSSNNFKHNRDQEMSYICREIKKLANNYELVIIVTSQLTRAVDNRGGTKQPQLSDLRDSGSIEQDADKVLMMFRMEYYGFYEYETGGSTKGIVDIIIAKNRNGGLGTAMLIADEEFTSFADFSERTDNFRISDMRLGDID